ncbi:alpha/beta fold hydrolase [Nocardioides terrisoli]|uniref:alpha/beta fold hydrolase n=1 Tax=Nocardioides terrisoli TaxID=3388267 RepID=UPI00287BB80A|nr:alpha/beta hydrolase [Nocardioides marmorisolisilvae]
MSRAEVGDIALELFEPDETGEPARTVPVVLLHGIGGSADTFAGVGPLLAAAGWRTVAWDAPGYGASADPGPEVAGPLTGPDSPGAYVELVAGLLERLDAPHAHLVGVSWGGVICTQVAVRRPEVVASLTLIDSTRGSATTPEKAAAMRGRVAELQAVGAEQFAAGRAPRLLADGADLTVAREVARQMSSVRLAGYAGAAEMMAQSDTGPVLSSITAPTLVLVGDQDLVTGVEESRLLADAIRQAQFGLVRNAGHAAVQEQPVEVADALLRFLAGLPEEAPSDRTRQESIR